MGKNFSFTSEKIMKCEKCKKYFVISTPKNHNYGCKSVCEQTTCFLCSHPSNENIRKYSKARFRGYRPRYAKQIFMGGYDVNGICRPDPDLVF